MTEQAAGENIKFLDSDVPDFTLKGVTRSIWRHWKCRRRLT
jgi:hypothetical protein